MIHEAETEYQYARVVEQDDGERWLELNEGQAQHSVYDPDTVLTGDVWDGHLVLGFAASASLRGGWRSSATPRGPPRAPTRSSSPARGVDGVEIDAELSRSAASTST